MARPAIHPGEILADELDELGVTPTELSRQLAVPPNRITQIVNGHRSITGDTALRLGHWFGTSAQFWLNLRAPMTSALPPSAPERKSFGCRPGVPVAHESNGNSPESVQPEIRIETSGL